jgi:hypothetical protein
MVVVVDAGVVVVIFVSVDTIAIGGMMMRIIVIVNVLRHLVLLVVVGWRRRRTIGTIRIIVNIGRCVVWCGRIIRRMQWKRLLERRDLGQQKGKKKKKKKKKKAHSLSLLPNQSCQDYMS